jgi:hypothetical protein
MPAPKTGALPLTLPPTTRNVEKISSAYYKRRDIYFFLK